METKQTAVEWLIERLEINNSVSRQGEFWNLLKNQAKQMEKEQMIEFADKVLDYKIDDLYLIYPVEEIYNETYGKENSN